MSVCKGHLLLVPTSIHPAFSDHSSSPPPLCSHVVSGVNLSVLFQEMTLVPGLVNQKVPLAWGGEQGWECTQTCPVRVNLRTLMEDFFPRSGREKELDLNSISAYFPGGSGSKASACNAGVPGSIPGSGRSPGEWKNNPLQYSCLENPMDIEAWWATVHGVAKSWTWLSDFTFTFNLFWATSAEIKKHKVNRIWSKRGGGEADLDTRPHGPW